MLTFDQIDNRSGWARETFIYRYPDAGGRRRVEVRYQCRKNAEWVCFLN
jgi:hypothetical protein